MFEILTLLAVGGFSLVALQKWWAGIWLCIFVGFFQDPLRKVVPDEPVYFVGLTAIVFAATVLGLIVRNYRFDPTQVPGWNNGVAQSILALFLVIVLQLAYSYYNFGSLLLVAFGMISYIAPLSAVFVGYYFACHAGEDGIEKVLKFYVLLCSLFSFGIYLEYFGFNNTFLGEVGAGLLIYDIGTVLRPYSGLFRSSEIAAWHIFFGSSLMMVIAVRSRSNVGRWLWVLGIIFLISAGILTGRRKLIVTIIIFAMVYWLLMMVFLRRAFRVALIILLLGASSLWVAIQNDVISEGGDGVYGLYVERASSVFDDIAQRAEDLGLNTVLVAIKRHGVFGRGAGSASQGAGLAGSGNRQYYESEGGLGRIVVETGLFGLLLIVWLTVVMIINIWKILRYLAYKQDSFSTICFGLGAILVANFAHFFIASQVFSDPFILLLLGLTLGLINSAPMLANMKDHRLRQAYSQANSSMSAG